MRRCTLDVPRGIAIAAFLLTSVNGPSLAQTVQTITLMSGHAEVRILNKAAGTIAVGNPKVADITLGTGNALILTGKSPGITNVIAMDQAGAEFFRATIQVIIGNETSIRIYNGTREGEGHLCSIANCIPSQIVTTPIVTAPT